MYSSMFIAQYSNMSTSHCSTMKITDTFWCWKPVKKQLSGNRIGSRWK